MTGPVSRANSLQFPPNWYDSTTPVTTPMANPSANSRCQNDSSCLYTGRLVKTHSAFSSATKEAMPMEYAGHRM